MMKKYPCTHEIGLSTGISKSLSFKPLGFLLFFVFCFFLDAEAQVSGVVFKDYNFNGIRTTAAPNEPLVAGIVVTAYNQTGAILASYTTTSATTPNYSIPTSGTAYNGTLGSNTGFVPAGTAVRLEFSNLPSSSFSSRKGTANNTSVQFVTAPSTTASFGVNDPSDYCHTTTPKIVVPCYESGSGDGTNSTNPSLVSFGYGSRGTTGTKQADANIGQLGTVWGSAYQAINRRLYSASFLRRHSALANGVGNIYMVDYTATGGSSFIGSFNLQGVNGIDLGSVTRTTTAAAVSSDNQLSNLPTAVSWDIDAFNKVGKISFGDAEITSDGQYLWVVNLNSRTLIRVNVSDKTQIPTDGSAISGSLVTEYSLASLGIPNCTNGVYRPFAISFHKGRGYIGGVCTGESIGATMADVNAYVHSFDMNNIAGGLTQEVSFNMGYNRELSYNEKTTFSSTFDIPGSWLPWQSSWGSVSTNKAMPQPILSNIEFSENGSMVLGFMDRFGAQSGASNYPAISGQTTLTSGFSTGDLIHVCNINNTWALEGASGCPDNDAAKGLFEEKTNRLPAKVF